jgi:hypothetical protein
LHDDEGLLHWRIPAVAPLGAHRFHRRNRHSGGVGLLPTSHFAVT